MMKISELIQVNFTVSRVSGKEGRLTNWNVTGTVHDTKSQVISSYLNRVKLDQDNHVTRFVLPTWSLSLPYLSGKGFRLCTWSIEWSRRGDAVVLGGSGIGGAL